MANINVGEEISKYVGTLIVFAVGLSLGSYAYELSKNTTLGIVSSFIVASIIGAGLLMLLVRAFF